MIAKTFAASRHARTVHADTNLHSWYGSNIIECIVRNAHRWTDFLDVFNPFPNMPFWDRPKFKEVAGNNRIVAIKGYLDTDCIENIVEKSEIAHYSNFTFFHNVFFKLIFFFNVLKWVY